MAAKKTDGRGKSVGSKKTQFQPGEPPPKGSGRKKGTPNRSTIIREVLSKVVTGDVGGEKTKIKLTKGILLTLAKEALTGDLKAIQMMLALWKESEDEIAAERQAIYPFNESDRQMIEGIYARMKACEETSAGE